MNINETLELDYLVEGITDDVVKVSSEPTSGASSIDYIATQTSVFNPSETGTYKLNINGQTVEIDVVDIPDSGIFRFEFEQNLDNTWGTNYATDNTSAGYSTDAAGGSYSKQFDGIDDWIGLGDFTISPSLTITLWFNHDSADNDYMLSGGYDGSTTEYHIRLRDDGTIQWSAYDGSTTHGLDNVSVNPSSGTWHHLAAVYENSNNEYRLYIDGSEVASASDSYGPSDADNSQQWTIGAESQDGSLAGYWSGLLDDVRYYDYVLTNSEIEAVYNNPASGG